MTLEELIKHLSDLHDQANGWPSLIDEQTLSIILFYLDVLSLKIEDDEHT